MFLTITLVVFFLLFYILFFPSTIHLDINLICDRYFLDITKQEGLKNRIKIKLAGVIPVFNKKLLEEEKRKKNENKKTSKFSKIFKRKETIYKLLDEGYIDRFGLSLGFNLEDYVANSYVNASLNSLICLYINLNQKKFNLRNLYYQTYIGENLVNLNLDCIIKISLADTIKVIAREYLDILKQSKQKILMYKKGSKVYGRTSN